MYLKQRPQREGGSLRFGSDEKRWKGVEDDDDERGFDKTPSKCPFIAESTTWFCTHPSAKKYN